MSTDKKTEVTGAMTGVRAKFMAEKENAGTEENVLPRSKVKITIPEVINHGAWIKAQRQAKGDVGNAQLAFIAATVRFEGEQLTVADLRELCDARDIMFMVAAIFGDEDDDELGNEEVVLN